MLFRWLSLLTGIRVPILSIQQVLDTNVVLGQMDLLENPSPAMSCVVILQTVMQVSEKSNHLELLTTG